MLLNVVLLTSYLVLLGSGVYLTGLRLTGDWMTALGWLFIWPALVGLALALRLRLALGPISGIGLVALTVFSPWLTLLLARPLLPMIRTHSNGTIATRVRTETLKLHQSYQSHLEPLFARPQRVSHVVDRYLIIDGGYALDLYRATAARLTDPPRGDGKLTFLGPLLTGKCVGVRLPDDFANAQPSTSYVTIPFRVPNTRRIPDIPVLVYLDGRLVNALVRERLGLPLDPLLTEYAGRFGPTMAEIRDGDCGT